MKMYDKKYNIFKFDYYQGARLVGKYRMPQLDSNQFIPQNVISFNERKTVANPEKHWVDFFIDDCLYENFWKNPEKSLVNMKKFAGIITTDYSMLPEMLPGQNIWNCTRNRVVPYYLQKKVLM